MSWSLVRIKCWYTVFGLFKINPCGLVFPKHFFACGPLMASKNNYGSSHPCDKSKQDRRERVRVSVKKIFPRFPQQGRRHSARSELLGWQQVVNTTFHTVHNGSSGRGKVRKQRRTQEGWWPQVEWRRLLTTRLHLILSRKTKANAT
jgi:hypothetical protein